MMLTEGQKDARRRAKKAGRDYCPIFELIPATKCVSCDCSLFGVSVCPNCGAAQ